MHRLGESAADQLRGHLEQGISDGHTQPCRAADLGWQLRLQWRSHALACTNQTIFVVHRCMVCVCHLPLSGARSPRPCRAGPKKSHFRVLFRQWLFLGPALQGRGASSHAQGQMTHTNHTPMNYKYCLVCACQGMASPLQSKLSPQISCATGLGVPIWYTLFKVSAQLVCSWLP